MRFIPLIIAILSGIGALSLGHVYLGRLEAEVGGGTRTAIIVAAEDIPVGATLTEKMLGTRELPQAYLERRHVPAAESIKVIGTRVNAGLQAGEALLRTDLAEYAADLRILSTLVPRGLRAIAIRAERESFDGLVRPGDRIDLLFSDSSGNGQGSVTRTLLQNLMVLAVGYDLGGETGSGQARGTQRAGNLTLSTTVGQAQLITEALRHGKLTVVLRNSDDIAIASEVPETTGADVAVATRRVATVGQPSKGGGAKEKMDNVR